MAASLRQVPAFLARRQPRVIGTTKRLASSSSIQTQNPAYPLYPSVVQLLHEKGIPESDVSKIPASGPKGRLLKGDVLAYLGTIASDYPATQAARIASLAHLDLSNIKIAAPAEAPKPAPAVEEVPVARPPPTTSVAVSISLAAVLSTQKKLQESLGVSVPLSTFLARAADLANDDLPRSPRAKPSADEIFDELLGGEPITTSRGDFVPELNAVAPPKETRSAKPVQEDIIDILSGKVPKTVAARRASGAESAPAEHAANVFSLTIPVGEEKRAQTFLDRVKTLLTVEPGRLVL